MFRELTTVGYPAPVARQTEALVSAAMGDGVHENEDDEAPAQSDAERCQECGGTGHVDGAECPACEGSGNVMHGLGGG